jgi:hypothetical protein
MSSYILAAIVISFVALLYILPHTKTRLGKLLRESDHAAWRDAVEEKERELAELRGMEPRK